MNKIIFLISVTFVSLVLISMLYAISLLLFIIYLAIGGYRTVKHVIKHKISLHSTFGGKVADVMYIMLLTINWLIFKMFNYTL